MKLHRREFILGGGATAAAPWAIGARAQQPAIPVIGFLSGRSANDSTANVAAFRRGLADAGFVEGHNIAIEYRWADGRYDRLPSLAAELVRISVSIIVTTGGTASALAAKHVSNIIPVIFLVAFDPVELGLVASHNRPGGNVTGVSFLVGELTAKRFELLRELAPRAELIGLIINPDYPDTKLQLLDAQAAVSALGRRLAVFKARTDNEIDAAFEAVGQQRVGGIVVGSDPFFNSRAVRIAALANREAVPAIYPLREYVAAGGLMSYGTSITEAHRQVADYVGRILKAEKPADLPVQQSTKVELIINLGTAKALGLDVPMSLLMRVDEVIE
jgi:putative ABC transport system substrate-binding protein